MSLSDIITILGLITAIIAFISDKNREYVFLKFSCLDHLLFLISFLLIHYLIAYQWFKEQGIYIEFFEVYKNISSAIWAYLITIGLLFYIYYKIYYSFFPNRNRSKVIDYYRNQVLKGEFSLVVLLIEKYHKKDIVNYLRNESNSGNRFEYAIIVYEEIVKDDSFLLNTALSYPYLFTDFISCLSSYKYSDRAFVERYLSILIKNNSYRLILELNNNQKFIENNRYALPVKNQILRSLFLDANVARYNYAWATYGDLTCKYLDEEAQKKYSPLNTRIIDENDDDMWEIRIYQAIWYFDIMLREAIAQKIDSHMWLYYFSYFIDGLIDNIKLEQKNNSDTILTKAHYLIRMIISVMCDWIELDCDFRSEKQYKSIVECIGWCLHSIAVSDKLYEEFKVECFQLAIAQYFQMSNLEDIESRLCVLEERFVNPRMDNNFQLYPARMFQYTQVMEASWAAYDKIPLQLENKNSLERFERKVLLPLNIIF
jgi:hypothetical protein